MQKPLDLLKESLLHFREHASLYLGYSAWILVPTLGIVLIDLLPPTDMLSITELVGAILIVVGTIVIVWVSIIMIHLAAAFNAKQKPNEQAIQKESLKQVIPLILVAVIQLFFYLGGLILLVVPLLLMIVWYSFAQISVVLDHKRGVEALSYSKQLVKGRFWYVALGMIGIPALISLAFAIVAGLIGFGIGLSTGQTLDVLLAADREPVWMTALNTLGQMLIIPVTSIYATKFYLMIKNTPLHPSLDTSLASDVS